MPTPASLRILVPHHSPSPKGLRPPHQQWEVPGTSQPPCSTQGFQTPIHPKPWESHSLLNPRGPRPFPPLKGPSPSSLSPAPRGPHHPPPPRPPAPRAPSPFPTSPACKGPNPPPLSKLQSPSSSLPTPSPKGSQPPPTPQNPGIQAPFHPLRILAPPQAPSTQGSQTFPTLKGPIPSSLAPSPLGPRFPTPSTQGCHHPPSATTRVSH